MVAASLHGVVGELQIGLDMRAGRAVVAVDELINQLLTVEAGVPQQLGQNPGPELSHLGAVGGVGALLENTFDIVVHEELDVRPQDSQVRVRHYVMFEVSGVVPDIKAVANFRPADDIIAEFFVAFIGQRFAEGTLDTAKAYDNVMSGFYMFGRLAGVLVGQRADSHVGEFLFDIGGDGINKPNHQTGGTGLLLFNSGAAPTLAVAGPIVL